MTVSLSPHVQVGREEESTACLYPKAPVGFAVTGGLPCPVLGSACSLLVGGLSPFAEVRPPWQGSTTARDSAERYLQAMVSPE